MKMIMNSSSTMCSRRSVTQYQLFDDERTSKAVIAVYQVRIAKFKVINRNPVHLGRNTVKFCRSCILTSTFLHLATIMMTRQFGHKL